MPVLSINQYYPSQIDRVLVDDVDVVAVNVEVVLVYADVVDVDVAVVVDQVDVVQVQLMSIDRCKSSHVQVDSLSSVQV